MLIDRPEAPDPTHQMDEPVESFDVPAYGLNVSVNGRHVTCLNRVLPPFARFIFSWLAWREKRRDA
jgi:hypothetical protein